MMVTAKELHAALTETPTEQEIGELITATRPANVICMIARRLAFQVDNLKAERDRLLEEVEAGKKCTEVLNEKSHRYREERDRLAAEHAIMRTRLAMEWGCGYEQLDAWIESNLPKGKAKDET